MTDPRTCTYEAFSRRIVTDGSVSLPLHDHTGPTDRQEAYPPIRIRRDDLPDHPDAVDGHLEQVYADPSGGFDAFVTVGEDERARGGNEDGERRSDENAVYWVDDLVGTLCVRGGTEITVSPASAASAEAVGRFVAGPGLRTAVGQQGDFVIHASAVEIGGKAVALAGPSGRGKSTAAAACAAHGHPILADDATVIARGTESTVLPEGRALSVDDATIEAVTRSAGHIDVDGGSPADTVGREPQPLTAIYLLEDGDRFETTRLSASRATFELLRVADTLYAADDRTAREAQLTVASTLADTVPVTRLERPRSLSRLDEFVARLETAVA